MSNEEIYKQLASNDVNKLLGLVSKGFYETSDFEEAVEKASDCLQFVAIAIRGKDVSKAKRQCVQASWIHS